MSGVICDRRVRWGGREAGLGWCGHVRRRDGGNIGEGVLGVRLPGGGRREWGECRFVVEGGMVGVTEGCGDSNNWRWGEGGGRCGDP